MPTRAATIAALQGLDAAVAVAERVDRDADLVEHRQDQVRHRRVIRILEMTAALVIAGRASDDEIRQREMVVLVAVAHVAAVEDERVIEERAVAVLNRVELA